MRGEDHWAAYDHLHDAPTGLTTDNIVTGNPVSIDPDDAQAPGVATSLARSDHQHQMTTAAAVAVGSSNGEGAAATFARSDHLHALPTEVDAIGASCRVARTTNQAIATGTPTAISWNSEISDPFGMHSNAVNPTRLTAPWTGYYAASCTVHWAVNTGGNYRKLSVAPNAAAQFQGLQLFGPLGVNTQPVNHLHVSGILLAAAGYIEFLVDHDAGSNRDVGGDFVGVNFTMAHLTYQGPG